MFAQKVFYGIIVLYLVLLALVDCGVITPREMEIRRSHQLELKKRPFCNAFTGCGKKRSSASLPITRTNNNHQMQNNGNQQETEDFDNSLSDLIDLNAEPAVEDLMRQIMSQAKLWEAIQEASKEISSQKIDSNDRHQNHRFPISFSSQ